MKECSIIHKGVRQMVHGVTRCTPKSRDGKLNLIKLFQVMCNAAPFEGLRAIGDEGYLPSVVVQAADYRKFMLFVGELSGIQNPIIPNKVYEAEKAKVPIIGIKHCTFISDMEKFLGKNIRVNYANDLNRATISITDRKVSIPEKLKECISWF